MSIDINAAADWIKKADLIFQTPLIRMAVIPLLKAMLPPLGVTPEQIAVLDAHYEDLNRREADARRRAGTRLDP